MNVTLLLCDAAEVSGGKLYILGAGWSIVAADQPATMALAVLIAVPWDRTNRRFTIDANLMTADGDQFRMGDEMVGASGAFEVGRPAGIKPGTDLNTPLALKFNNLVLPADTYRWELLIDGTTMATAPFDAREGGLP